MITECTSPPQRLTRPFSRLRGPCLEQATNYRSVVLRRRSRPTRSPELKISIRGAVLVFAFICWLSLNSSVVHRWFPVVGRLMGPPLASLAKAKFALAPDSHHVVMDEDDSEECMFAYKLLLFARDEIFQMKGCQGTAHLRVLCRLPDNL